MDDLDLIRELLANTNVRVAIRQSNSALKAQRAIGKPFMIRTEKRRNRFQSIALVSGTIERCEVIAPSQWHVWLRSPNGKVLHGPFVVRQLPR